MIAKDSLAATAILAASVIGAAGYHGWRHYSDCVPHFDAAYTYMPASKSSPRFRAILIPGMDGTAANFLSGSPNKAWAIGLTSLGGDVVVLNTPIPSACWFSDGGGRYRAAFLQELDGVLSDATARHGKAARTLIAGVSYGGLHALVAYASRPGFVGWQAALPVTKLSVLGELEQAGAVPQFDAFAEVPKLAGSTGFISWGAADMRVDHRLDERLYALLKSDKVGGVGYAGVAHTLTAKAVADLLADAKRQISGQHLAVATSGGAR